ncbi:hypothetical protein TEQG_00539 [Trichophyton equinum CBS 127.97]|uniref:Uncharacterized protein n=1 Tax=Trichophyton equinum (strain ATCC MYA-4606 / CBS 127.97) TaxID=559882 RepID=F2PHS6_TRIEC|nr:hypothetical protein TEQG_00539 [Trichophyton equinum CBS 127.97]
MLSSQPYVSVEMDEGEFGCLLRECWLVDSTKTTHKTDDDLSIRVKCDAATSMKCATEGVEASSVSGLALLGEDIRALSEEKASDLIPGHMHFTLVQTTVVIR